MNPRKPEQIIYIAGVARSGTSWIGQVINSSPEVCFRFQPLFAYEFKNRVNEESSREAYEELFQEIYETETEFLIQGSKQASGEYPRFQKNPNMPVLAFKENRYQSVLEPMLRRVPYLKALGVVRHPCAVLNSWRKNEKEFPPGADIMREWRFGECKNEGPEDYFGYYKWKEVANLYMDLAQKYPGRFMLVHYDQVVRAPQARLREILEFLEVSVTEATCSFIEESTRQHNRSYYSVYKDKSVLDQWRSELPDYIVNEIYADLEGTRLARFLESLDG